MNENLMENQRTLAKLLELPEDAKGADIVQKLVSTMGHELTLYQLIGLAHTCDLDLQVYVVDHAGDVAPQNL